MPENFGFTTTYFDLPGLRMHAAVAGPVDGPLLLLLHGFPECWLSWRDQIGPLAQAGYRVVAPDQRGYNLSDKTPPFDLDTLTADIVNLMQACGRDSACLAGHDWGAAVAWALAGSRPERVSRLAILNVPHPAPIANALRGGDLRQMLKSWYIFFFQIPRFPEWALSRSSFAVMRRMMIASSRPGTFTGGVLDDYREAWARPGALSAMIGWYRALMRTALHTRGAAFNRRITMPTVILWGEHDIALRVELAEQSLAWLDDGKLIRFPLATHWVHEDFPAEITQHLLAHFGPAVRPAG
jgi:pimeloyl-ACP methyl ester carboxylesterase